MEQPVVPTIVGGCRVLLFTELDDRHVPTGACRHVVDGQPLHGVLGLAICAATAPDAGFFLFYCEEDFIPITDTWHRSLEDAMHQAELEYAGVSSTWEEPPV